jgi:hypothetical protein
MTNQQKITSIINQAQKNGWMEGWEISGTTTGTTVDGEENISRYIFCKKENTLACGSFSLSDVIFDKDFADSFFHYLSKYTGENFCDYCSTNGVLYSSIFEQHILVLTRLNTQERIDFLYKHVEEKEEEYATGDFSCPSNTVITCGKHKEYMHFSDWDLYHAHMKEHAKPKCEPIEELKLRIFEGDFDFTLDKALEDIHLKINELIRHHNERCHDTK